ncbi:MAG: CoA-binding protein, partial [Chloroflexota bacterium]|nr:CoA-binding protein [Chloroflexota bacterium]
MMNIKAAATEFLAKKRIAVTGVSREPQGHGSNVVYKRLRERGYQVFAVNPNADELEGDKCYRDLAAIPGGVEAVVIGTRPELAESTMRECV